MTADYIDIMVSAELWCLCDSINIERFIERSVGRALAERYEMEFIPEIDFSTLIDMTTDADIINRQRRLRYEIRDR